MRESRDPVRWRQIQREKQKQKQLHTHVCTYLLSKPARSGTRLALLFSTAMACIGAKSGFEVADESGCEVSLCMSYISNTMKWSRTKSVSRLSPNPKLDLSPRRSLIALARATNPLALLHCNVMYSRED